MKRIFASTLLCVIATQTQAHTAAPHKAPPHFDLEMTSNEYRKLLATDKEDLSGTDIPKDDPLEPILERGKRLLDWIEVINAARPLDRRLALSTPATQRGIPITAPSVSNREIVLARWTEVTAVLPQQMIAVVINGADFPTELDVADEEFIVHARAIDRSYQHAARWILQEPYMAYYTWNARNDVRGFYHLTNDPNRAERLRTFTTQASDVKASYEAWLVGICVNALQPAATCREALQEAITDSGDLTAFYEQYIEDARAHWDSYFKIPEHRSDVIWTANNPTTMKIPFRNPQDNAVVRWLRDNIEDEFRWFNWRLILDFQDDGDDSMTHIVFLPGVNPHVDRLAGSKIVMDANRSIDEYTSRWTIRHEYGHVLGLPDCYLEFYDESAGAMINYQLDITDLMCARTGAFKQNHFDELRRVYYSE